jgi:hypothetical protein
MSKGLFQQSTKERQTQVFSSMSWEDWRRWVTEQRQEYSQRLSAGRLTNESECSSVAYPTPDVTMRPHEGNVRLYRKAVMNGMPKEEADGMLGADCFKQQGAVPKTNWATPNTMDNLPPKSQRALDHEAVDVRAGRKQPNNLRDQIAVKDGCRKWNGVSSQADQANPNTTGSTQEPSVTRKLSPLWVAQLMGLPTALWCIPVEWMRSDSSVTE